MPLMYISGVTGGRVVSCSSDATHVVSSHQAEASLFVDLAVNIKD